MGRVSGKVAIVTGGASGVGKDGAILLVKEGARVVLTDLNEKDGNTVAAHIGENALFVKHDISSEDGWKEVIARTEENFGGVDILVNNAAILIAGTIEDTTLENWQKIQRVNSDGYFLGCKDGYAAMKKRGGSIVNMSSMAGIGGVSSFCAYSAPTSRASSMARSTASTTAT
jgi:3(or 17)beta-hydroxysteroid dehydrogenase